MSYNFLYLTTQEYLAAVDLSMQPTRGSDATPPKKFMRMKAVFIKFHNHPQQNLARY